LFLKTKAGDEQNISYANTEIAGQSSAELTADLDAITAGQKDYQALKDKPEARKAAKK